jgi:hypothetical protein
MVPCDGSSVLYSLHGMNHTPSRTSIWAGSMKTVASFSTLPNTMDLLSSKSLILQKPPLRFAVCNRG